MLNTFSVKWSIIINNVLNWFKIACIIIMVGIGTVQLFRGGTKHFEYLFKDTSTQAGSIGNAFFQGLWAFDGWNNLNYAAEEMKNPTKTLPRSITVGMILVTVFYTLINIAYVSALGKTEMLQSSAVALTVGQKYLGVMAWIVPALVACSTFGATNSTIFSNGRLLFVAAREGHLPKILSSIHVNYRTPVPSLFFTAFISIILLIPPSDKIDELIGFFTFASWVFFGICFAVQIHIRLKRPDIPKPFKVWIFIPFVMIFVSLFLIILPIFHDYKGSLIATGIIASGIPVYLLFFTFGKIIHKKFYQFIDKITNKLMDVYSLALAKSENEMG